MIEELKKELSNTPIEVLKNEWAEIEKKYGVGPKVNDLIEHWKFHYDFKGIKKELKKNNKIKTKTPKFEFFGVFFCKIVV